MTKYIKGKDGKFAGSIGNGKNSTPTSMIMPNNLIPSQGSMESSPLPNYYFYPEKFPHQQEYTDFVESHLTAWSELAAHGHTPESIARYSRMSSADKGALVGHLSGYIDKRLYTPKEIEGLIDDRENSPGANAQRTNLINLIERADHHREYVEVIKWGCEQCSEYAEDPDDTGECNQHKELFEDQHHYEESVRMSSYSAVLEDSLPTSFTQEQAESGAVITALQPSYLSTLTNRD
jgi:hypothetical protein